MRTNSAFTSALIAALVAVSAVALSPAAGVESETGLAVRLVEAPSDRRDDPRATVYIVDHVEPGSQFSRRLEVTNLTGSDTKVAVYPGVATIRDGGFVVADRGAPGDLIDWVRVEPDSVTVDDGARQQVTVTIDVPATASSGERYGVIWAELPPVVGSSGVGQVNRVGIRIYLSVGDGEEPKSDFEVKSLRAERRADGTPVVTALIRNTGRRALDLRGSLQLLEGPGGTSAGPFPATLGTTLGVDQTAPVVVTLDPTTPAGPWLARLAAQSGVTERVAEARVTFPEAGESAEPVPATAVRLAEDPKILIPIAGSLILLIILGLLWWLITRRRNRAKQEDAAPAPVAAG